MNLATAWFTSSHTPSLRMLLTLFNEVKSCSNQSNSNNYGFYRWITHFYGLKRLAKCNHLKIYFLSSERVQLWLQIDVGFVKKYWKLAKLERFKVWQILIFLNLHKYQPPVPPVEALSSLKTSFHFRWYFAKMKTSFHFRWYFAKTKTLSTFVGILPRRKQFQFNAVFSKLWHVHQRNQDLAKLFWDGSFSAACGPLLLIFEYVAALTQLNQTLSQILKFVLIFCVVSCFFLVFYFWDLWKNEKSIIRSIFICL